MRAQYGEATVLSARHSEGDLRHATRTCTVVGIANLLVVSETMPEALAYDITRLLFEKQAELVAIHPQARDLSLATAVKGSPVPFHPGAIRYYTEKERLEAVGRGMSPDRTGQRPSPTIEEIESEGRTRHDRRLARHAHQRPRPGALALRALLGRRDRPAADLPRQLPARLAGPDLSAVPDAVRSSQRA